MPEDLQVILRTMSERLARIEASLETRQCDHHNKWLGDHEKRIRYAEMKITVLWLGFIFVSGILGWWFESKLRGM